MSSSKVRWGVISTGRIAGTFAEAMPGSKSGTLAAVASRSLDKAKEFAEKYGAARAFGSYEELFASSEIDAVYIATPHPSHARLSILAARAKKHILCEKPLGINAAEVMAMIEAARENDVLLMEAFMYRCHPQTERVVELIKSGALGQVRSIHSTFSFRAGFNPESRLFNAELGGGGLLDVGCYPVSFSRMVAGAAQGKESIEPVEVHALGVLNPTTKIDEICSAVLKFPGDVLATLSSGVALGMDNSAQVFGTEGSLHIPSPWQPGVKGGATELVLKRGGNEERIRIESDRPLYAYEIDKVAEHLSERRVRFPAMAPSDSLGNAKVLDQIRQAIGVVYPGETLERPVETLSGLPLKKREPAVMPYAPLATLKKRVSRLIFGCDNQPNITHAAVMLDAFFEAGGTTFDTAYVYGRGKHERQLGHWVKSRGLREEVVIVGKGGHTPNCNPVAIERELGETLDRLGTDYVDVYLLHRDNLELPVSELVDVLNRAFRAGKVKCFGGSNWSRERIDAANEYAKKEGLEPMRILSNQFSLARMVEAPWNGCLSCSDPESRRWLLERQMTVLAWSSQARGMFSDRAAPHLRSDELLVRSFYSDDNFERKRRAEELAKKMGVPATSIAAAYTLAQPFPIFALIGPRVLDELRESISALNVKLTPDHLAWLNLEKN